jgi:hypothetical protein
VTHSEKRRKKGKVGSKGRRIKMMKRKIGKGEGKVNIFHR